MCIALKSPQVILIKGLPEAIQRRKDKSRWDSVLATYVLGDVQCSIKASWTVILRRG